MKSQICDSQSERINSLAERSLANNQRAATRSEKYYIDNIKIRPKFLPLLMEINIK